MRKYINLRPYIGLGLIITFLANMLMPLAQADEIALPQPGAMISLSPNYEPLLIKGLKVNPHNPFALDFIFDTGNSTLTANTPQLKNESSKLIKYFFAALTIPEKDLWVNLSPYEKQRMIAPNTAQTEMGRDMLAQDYILKQLTASLIYPEKNLGRVFWDKVYAKAREVYGTTQIPVNNFNKVWIVADSADIFEHDNIAYITGAHLKVMLEEDYLAKTKHQPTKTSSITSQIVRQIILPAIENEVNQGQNFAPLRQMFYSLILASWYKMALKDALLTQVYGNQSKVKVGINQSNPGANDKIFDRYLQAYKKGVFNFIKSDLDQSTHQMMPRKYFSGGESFAMLNNPAVVHRHQPWKGRATGSILDVSVNTELKHLPKSQARNAAMVILKATRLERKDLGEFYEDKYQLLIRRGRGTEKIVVLIDCPKLGDNFPLSVIFHGWQSSKEDAFLTELAHAVVKRGYVVVRPDFRNHKGQIWDKSIGGLISNGNESSGDIRKFIWGDSLIDFQYVWEFLRTSSELPHMNLSEGVVLMGHSYGGWTARGVTAQTTAFRFPPFPFPDLKVKAVIDLAGGSPERSLPQIIKNRAAAYWSGASFLFYGRYNQILEAWREKIETPFPEWSDFDYWFSKTNQLYEYSPYLFGVPYTFIVGTQDNIIYQPADILPRFDRQMMETWGGLSEHYQPSEMIVVDGMNHFFNQPYRSDVIAHVLERLSQIPFPSIPDQLSKTREVLHSFPIPQRTTEWDRLRMKLAISTHQHWRYIPLFVNNGHSLEFSREVRVRFNDRGEIQFENIGGGIIKELKGMAALELVNENKTDERKPVVKLVINEQAPYNHLALESALATAFYPDLLGWHLKKESFIPLFEGSGIPHNFDLNTSFEGQHYSFQLLSEHAPLRRDSEIRYRLSVDGDFNAYAGEAIIDIDEEGILKGFEVDMEGKQKRRYPGLNESLNAWFTEQLQKPFDWRNPVFYPSAVPKEAVSRAMVAKDGGIDLNHLKMNVHQQGLSFAFDPAMVERIKKAGFDGLDFEIKTILPINNLPSFLGIFSKI